MYGVDFTVGALLAVAVFLKKEGLLFFCWRVNFESSLF
jgi:hypothetical protein